MNNWQGKNNPNYKNGECSKEHFCKDCNDKIGLYSALYGQGRCHKCQGIQRRGKTKYYCLDCNREITFNAKRCRHCANIGKKNPSYIDGRTTLKHLIRQLDEYIIWRNQCIQRDNYICQRCESKKKLEVHHHKKSFEMLLSEFLQEYNQFSPIEDKETLVRLAINWKPFWDIDNGETVCNVCHLQIEPRHINKEN